MMNENTKTNNKITTEHSIHYTSSMEEWPLSDNSVDLIVTSPPYPMIEMWDELFYDLFDSEDAREFNGNILWELMHMELEKVWYECFRVLKDGGFACLNIGDAVRTVKKKFQLYPNHAEVMGSCFKIGFNSLPIILWRKQTNAPNKFMGSGMLPAGAYVTLENEFILIFRKGDKRTFTTPEDKLKRRESAFFWEERNRWFSDVWDFKGTKQTLGNKRDILPGDLSRSGAFPFELPYRLINMYSLKGDTVVDPFLGTGTTTLAAMASCRNSIGFEFKKVFKNIITNNINTKIDFMNHIVSNRLSNHLNFVTKTGAEKFKYSNKYYNCHVKTQQETDLLFNRLLKIGHQEESEMKDIFSVEYNDRRIGW